MHISDNYFILILALLILSLGSLLYSVKLSNNHIPDKSIFCGLKSLPRGYGRYGNRYECLRRGFGAGMNKTDKEYPLRKWCSVFIILSLGILVYNYNNKKDRELQLNENN